jgi:hypothetical protein
LITSSILFSILNFRLIPTHENLVVSARPTTDLFCGRFPGSDTSILVFPSPFGGTVTCIQVEKCVITVAGPLRNATGFPDTQQLLKYKFWEWRLFHSFKMTVFWEQFQKLSTGVLQVRLYSDREHFC